MDNQPHVPGSISYFTPKRGSKLYSPACKKELPHLAGCFMLIVGLLSVCNAKAEIQVDDNEIPPEEIIAEASLTGFRQLPPEMFISDSGRTGIPSNLFIEFVCDIQEVKQGIITDGKDPSSANIHDWYKASRWNVEFSGSKLPPKEVKVGYGKTLVADPLLIASLPQTEFFKGSKPHTFTKMIQGKNIEFLEVDPDAFSAVKGSYVSLSSHRESPIVAQKKFTTAKARIAQYPLLSKATEFIAGQVSFGMPKVFTRTEKKLEVPISLLNGADVYWIEFAVSFRDLDASQMEELTFGVITPEDTIALELIPLRHEKEMTTKTTKSSPDLDVSAGGFGVKVGKVYEQEVVFKTMMPTVLAEGLQEHSFSWSLRDEAVQKGSKRFIGVLQVPKGRRTMSMQLQAGGKTKGPWYASGDIVSTKAEVKSIILPN